MTRRAIVLTFVAACLAVTAAFAGNAAEMKKFDGKWKVTRLETEGQQVGSDDVPALSLKFEGAELVYDSGEGEKKGTYKIDPEKTPKEIDISHKSPTGEDETLKGIYKFEDKKLILCLPVPGAGDVGRPSEFKTVTGSKLILITLEHPAS
jgi:uncharacterized protein (TIGR03067 family)